MNLVKTVVFFELLFFMFGCPVIDTNTRGNVHLSFNVQENRSTVMPEVSLAVIEYRIKFSGGPESVGPVITSTGSINIDLLPGTWNIAVEGLNNSGQTVASGLLQDIIVSTGIFVSKEVDLNPIMTRAGSVHITVTWPEDIQVNESDITVYFDSDTVIPMSSDTITYSNADNCLIYNNPSVTSGSSHWIKIYLVENGTANQDIIFDSVHVYDNLESSAVYNLSSSDFIIQPSSSLVANHLVATESVLRSIPESAITSAKDTLHVAYGHTSHGSQITNGMTGLVSFMNGQGYGSNLFSWNNGGSNGALDLHDNAMGGDVGYYPQWVDNTRDYLQKPSNSDVNVIIWSWCGQVASRTEQSMLDTYLIPMTQLEEDYPNITFIYMTGHLDGSGLTGNLHDRNDQIRDYCSVNKKVLYDFENIESYDPDGAYYGDKIPNDNCDYDSNNNGERDANWAINWQNSHVENTDWYSCGSAHSQPLNANRKAYAIWWLLSGIAGWDGNP